MKQGPDNPDVRRSSQWPAVRRAFLRQNPRCLLCGNDRSLNVHHVEPYHTHPERELDPTNLITLCERSEVPDLFGLNCHQWAGHLGNWSSVNPRVREVVRKLAGIVQDGI
jgi:hypothetical protein